MLTGLEFIQKNYSNVEEEERLYSTGNEELDELLEKAFCDGYEYAQKEFGGKSKVLGLFAPGAYQAKEAAKYLYDDEDEYKKHRAGYALKGLFTPGTATYIKKHVEEMEREGASKEEIRKYLENEQDNGKKWLRRGAGIAEATIGLGGGITVPVAHGVGIYDKVTGHRATYKNGKRVKKEDEE